MIRPAMRPTDDMWRDVETLWCTAPCELPTVGDLRKTLLALARAAPNHRLMCRLDKDSRRWLPVATADLKDHITELVTSIDAGPGDAEGLAQRWLAAYPHHDGLPFRLELGDRVLRTSLPHVFGDWTFAEQVEVELIRGALTSRPPDALLRRSSPAPLTHALRGELGRRGRGFLGVLRTPLLAAHAGTSSPLASLARPRPALAVGGSSDGAVTRAIAWRSENARAQSLLALVISAAVRVLTRHGFNISSRLHMLVDGRRYLPATSYVAGNFVTGVHLDAADPRDPRSVQSALRYALAEGRPLAALTRGAVAAQLPRRGGSGLSSLLLPELTPLSVSFVQRAPGTRWLGELGDRQFVGGAWGGWTSSINLQVVMDGEILAYSAGYDAGVIDGAALTAAMRDLAQDPLGSLSSTNQ